MQLGFIRLSLQAIRCVRCPGSNTAHMQAPAAVDLRETLRGQVRLEESVPYREATTCLGWDNWGIFQMEFIVYHFSSPQPMFGSDFSRVTS
jgi:hypothetical protein